MKGVTAFCWCGRSQRGTFSISKWIILTGLYWYLIKVLYALTKSSISYAMEHLLICACIFLSALVSLCVSPLSLPPILIEALLFPPERLRHPCRWGTRRTWRFPWIKNLRAIKSRPTPGIHQPCVLLPGWVRGTRSKPQAIYFYICFPSKEGRLWQNYVLLSPVPSSM